VSISENRDLRLGPIPAQRIPERIKKLLNWIASEITPVISRALWENLIEVRVLFEGKTFVVFVTAKIPKDFWQI